MGFLIPIPLVIGLFCVVMAVLAPGSDAVAPAVIGAALIVGSWVAARFERGTSMANLIGTGYFGDIVGPEGLLITTKWICIMFPLLPVRSYIVHGETKRLDVFMGVMIHHRVTPVAGFLGLNWTSVARTARFVYLGSAAHRNGHRRYHRHHLAEPMKGDGKWVDKSCREPRRGQVA